MLDAAIGRRLSQILAVRTVKEGSDKKKEGEDGEQEAEASTSKPQRQFLVAFADGRDDEWVDEANMSAEVIEDWEGGIEYGRAEEVLDVVQVGAGWMVLVLDRSQLPITYAMHH